MTAPIVLEKLDLSVERFDGPDLRYQVYDDIDEPPSYRADYARLAQRLSQLGLSEQDIAFAFAVSVATIDDWKRNHSEFRSALETGMLYANCSAGLALLRRALGAWTTVNTVIRGKIVALNRQIPPDTNALIKWLTTHDPENWE